MNSPDYKVRRATVDDLAELAALWNSMRLPADQLERRLREFQVAVDGDGALLGAIGMDIIERHGRIHSEAFNDFAHADLLRIKLWERMQSLAASHGLARLWTAEVAPFWRRNGFHAADADELKRLPPAWNLAPAEWATLPLRDEDALRAAVELNVEALLLQERQQTNRIMSHGRTLKYIALGIVALVVIAAIVFCISLLRHVPNIRRY